MGSVMRKISTAEFGRRLNEWTTVAQKEPVTITGAGAANLVLTSEAEYARLKALEEGATKHVWVHDLPADVLDEIINGDVSHLPKD